MPGHAASGEGATHATADSQRRPATSHSVVVRAAAAAIVTKTRTGPAEQPHVYPWATALRVPTDHGDVWFKATIDALRHEAALTELIAARRPDAVPTLLATDAAAGWMLMADAGESLRTIVAREHSLDRWLRVLPLYAGIQLDTAADVQELLALGVPDMRLAALPKAQTAAIEDTQLTLKDGQGVPIAVFTFVAAPG